MAYDIFLSYRRVDQPVARAVVTALEARGVRVWWDQIIDGGEDWRDAIVTGLTQSDMLVILFSEDCNQSKQLKKELAIADQLDKVVVPVLIEDTEPKGHFLYELVARNWVQIYPHPERKAGDLADKLAGMVSETRGGPPAAAAPSDLQRGALRSRQEQPAPSQTIAPDAPPTKADIKAQARALKAAKREAKKARLRDFLPFRGIDILPIFALLVVGAMYGMFDFRFETSRDIGQAVAWFSIIISAYGALVFPIRYFMRKRRVGRALTMYLLSSLVLFSTTMLGIWIYNEGNLERTIRESAIAIAFWAVFATIAAVLYGILHGQRTLRNFRSNVEKI